MPGSLPQFLSLLGLGLSLGLTHALDADHVVSVSAIASETRDWKKSSLLGVFWGLGHTSTLLIAGLGVLVFKLAIPDRLALSFEFVVGIVLVLLGANVLRKLAQDRAHLHRHTHDGQEHVHLHSHHDDPTHAHRHAHRSLLIGMLHGLAGSGALMLLALASVRSVGEGLVFILVFGLGSTLGMFGVSAAISLPILVSARFAAVHTGIRAVAGIISVVLGAAIMIEIGVMGGGLF